MLFDEATEYRLVSTLFLRLLALIYFVAFASVFPQISGLVGPEGILPFTEELAYLERETGNERYWTMPTLFWLGAGDWALRGAALAGCVFPLLLFLNRLPRLSLIILFLLYLSLVKAGQLFFNFQWDYLLLENCSILPCSPALQYPTLASILSDRFRHLMRYLEGGMIGGRRLDFASFSET